MASPVPKFFSLPNVLIGIGLLLFGLFLLGYFVISHQKNMEDLGTNLSFAGLNYFLFPLFIGIALKLSTTPPAPILKAPPANIEKYRTQATPIQNQVYSDITKQAYFKAAHMSEALKRIGLSKRDEELPILAGYWETLEEEHYALHLRFNSPKIGPERWETCRPKLGTFFGKGVDVRVNIVSEEVVEVSLVNSGQAA
ncbi:MAG: DUF2854 domain-containing protein [Anaerolineae bacterium]|nr:DUF2854 domain-containing protein [Gloeobacterales cyanobacterium ES-bin-313]